MVSVNEFWKSILKTWIRHKFTSKSFWQHVLNFDLEKQNLKTRKSFYVIVTLDSQNSLLE